MKTDYELLLEQFNATSLEIIRLREKLNNFCKARDIHEEIENLSLTDLVRFVNRLIKLRIP